MQKSRESASNLGVFNFLKAFQLKSNELEVYNMLAKKPMTIKQLQTTTKMSERSLRMHLDDLIGKNFVRRKVIEGKHLKYVYYANSGEHLLGIIKKRIDDIEKNRLRKREEIIRGYEELQK